jgi:diacylglycerol kinase family enzyme
MRVHYDVVVTETFMQEESVVKLKVVAARHEPLRIIVCGTMETLHFVINGLIDDDEHKNIELGYLPYDGICDVFSTFKDIAAGTQWSIENLMYGKSVSMDVIKVNKRYAISTVNFGIDTRFALLRAWLCSWLPFIYSGYGMQRRLTAAIEYASIFSRIPKHPVTLFVNGYETIIEDYFLLVFANTRTYSGGYICSADAESDDGQLGLYLMKRVPFWNIPKILQSYRNGTVLKNDFMLRNALNVSRRIVKADVSFGEGKAVDVCLDGNVYMRESSLRVEVVPAAVRFIVPNLSIDTPTSFGTGLMSSVTLKADYSH